MHVHSQWSWDAPDGDMEESCRRALQLGLPAIAFSEHADFTPWIPLAEAEVPAGTRVASNRGHRGDLDIAGYWEGLDRCRAGFPDLNILSAIEFGEPHLFPAEVAALLGRTPDRVLGSLHCLPMDGVLIDLSSGVITPETAADRFRSSLQATLALVESDAPFAILAHIDYAKRYWPHRDLEFAETDFEDEYRAVLRALAKSERVLEINTTRGIGPPRGQCPGPVVLRWWHDEGGGAVSFGSDAHRPTQIAAGFAVAAAMAEAAGFRPAPDPTAFWLR